MMEEKKISKRKFPTEKKTMFRLIMFAKLFNNTLVHLYPYFIKFVFHQRRMADRYNKMKAHKMYSVRIYIYMQTIVHKVHICLKCTREYSIYES